MSKMAAQSKNDYCLGRQNQGIIVKSSDSNAECSDFEQSKLRVVND
jgi:hypothetical protein